MKYIKKYENFTDDIYAPEAKFPELNQATKKEATDFVERALNQNGMGYLMRHTKYQIPKYLTGPELDAEVEKLKEVAIEFFSKNPELIPAEPTFDFFKVNTGSDVPKTNKVGGALRE